jgi:predicted MFS family arabinose efflux permease
VSRASAPAAHPAPLLSSPAPLRSFFKDEVGLTPVHVNILYCCVPVGLSLASVACQRASRVLGRVQAMALFKICGIALLYVMACLPSLWTAPAYIVPIYLARTCIMNATYPLQKSILMDYVPKRSRAKWNSFEAVTSFGWSGSAALGGWLIQQYGFDLNFTVTATLQLAAWCVMLLLLPLVPRQEGTAVVAGAAGPAEEGRREQRGRADDGAGAV